MIEFIEGEVAEISPTHVVIRTGGVGYFIHISLYSYEHMVNHKSLKVITHLSVKEDSHTLYGFYNSDEREVFRQLISVAGIGTATARVIISSLNQKELVSAILSGNVSLLRSIKGIGPKAAQRMILELQDKLAKLGEEQMLHPIQPGDKTREAVDALLALGFARSAAEKAVVKVRTDSGGGQTTEELIKKSLKLL